MRGATPYGLRGTALAIPNGTLDNPAIRFGRERSGFYRSADGRLSLAVKKFQAIEVTQDDVFVRSNTDAPVVSPLAMARVSPVTADGQEIALDVYNGTFPAARLSAYRQAAGSFGWRLYGSAANARLGVPALTIAPDGDVSAGRDLTALRDVIGTRDGLFGRNLGVTGAATVGTTLGVTGATTLGGALGVTGPTTVGQFTASGPISLGGTFGVTGPVTFDGAISGPPAGLQLVPRVGIGTAAPASNLHVIQDALAAALRVTTVAPGDAYPPAIHLANSADAGTVTRSVLAGLAQAAGQLVTGTVAGDGALLTQGSAGGRLLLGSHGVAKLILDAASTGIRFMQGATELARLTNTGDLGIGIAAPLARLHVHATADDPAQGLYLSYGGGRSNLYINTLGACRWTAFNNSGVALFHNENTFAPWGDNTTGLGSPGRRWANLYAYNATISGDLLVSNGISTPSGAFTSGVSVTNAPGLGGVSVSGVAGPGPQLRVDNIPAATRYIGFMALVLSTNGYTFPSASSGTLAGDVFVSTGGAGAATNGRLVFGSNQQIPRMLISTNGRVSVGTNCLEGLGKFNVYPDSDTAGLGFRIYHSNRSHYIGIRNDVFGRMIFEINDVPLLQLAANGSLLLGTTPTDAHRFLIKQPGDSAGGGLSLESAGNTARASMFCDTAGGLSVVSTGWATRLVIGGNAIYPAGSGTMPLGIPGNRWSEIYLSTDTAQKTTSTTWQVTCDRRTKVASSIRDYTPGLAEILALRPRSFRTNGLGGTEKLGPEAPPIVGFIADEAESAAPDLVKVSRQKLRPDDAGEDDIKMLDLHALFFMLTRAVQELHARLETLERNAA